MIFSFEIEDLLVDNEEAKKEAREKPKGSKQSIIHIYGTKYSGKTTILKKIENQRTIYDIAKFYEKHNCITNGEMNWPRFTEVIHLLPEDIENFMESNEDSPLVIIESSGVGKNVNQVIDDLEREGYVVHRICLAPPPIEDLERRRRQRLSIGRHATNIESEIRFLNIWNDKYGRLMRQDKKYPVPTSTELAMAYINSIFEAHEIDEHIKTKNEIFEEIFEEMFSVTPRRFRNRII